MYQFVHYYHVLIIVLCPQELCGDEFIVDNVEIVGIRPVLWERGELSEWRTEDNFAEVENSKPTRTLVCNCA